MNKLQQLLSAYIVYVWKFGGSSAATPEALIMRMKAVKQEMKKLPSNAVLIIVQSAFGITTQKLINLFNKARQARNSSSVLTNLEIEIEKEIIQYFESFVKELQLDIDLSLSYKILRETCIVYALDDNMHYSEKLRMDQVLVWGEITSRKVFSCYLEKEEISHHNLPAEGYFFTDDTYGEANPFVDIITGKIAWEFENKLSHNKIFLTEGFIGRHYSTRPLPRTDYNTTLGREGSDRTAVVWRNITEAGETVFWKDVPCIKNKEGKLLSEITVDELLDTLEISTHQFLHKKCVEALKDGKGNVRFRSYKHLENPGTLIIQ